MESTNKTIAKNTIFLYIRMMFTMVVSLFTSRVILRSLGVDDYGIYQAVGGIVGFLSFINSALSSGTSRFLTFELGTGNSEKLRKTFSTLLTVHIGIALAVVLVAETAGFWFVCNRMVIAPERFDAAKFVFHISILTAVFTLTQVPYNASIISHEKMSVFAYISIVEVCAKLAISYLIKVGTFDRLKLYAFLLCLLNVGLMVFYRIYCGRNYVETRYKPKDFDKSILKEVLGFSGWSLFSNGAVALNSQGILVLLNMFFTPEIVTARAVSLQVNNAANQFVTNFRTAANPQIVKKLASGDVKGSHALLIESTKFSYYLMLLLALPICLLASPLLKLWLGIVPEYSVTFLQIVIVQSLVQVFDTSFYVGLYAYGRLRENALLCPTIGFLSFPITYVFFKLGYSPVVLSWASLGSYSVIAFFVKPMLIVKIAKYSWRDVWDVFRPCLLVTVVALPLPLVVNHLVDTAKLRWFFGLCAITILEVCVVVWFIGLDETMRKKILGVVAKRLGKK